MLALGKALHLACEFEAKCQRLFRHLNLIDILDDIDDLRKAISATAKGYDTRLVETIRRMEKLTHVRVSSEDIMAFTKARHARNLIAHEIGKVGPIGDLRSRDIADAFSALRQAVIDLAHGDHIVSAWHLAIYEKQGEPEWIRESYEARVLSWIFGDPFSGPYSEDEWVLAQLAEQNRADNQTDILEAFVKAKANQPE